MTETNAYHETRFAYDARRAKLWQVLTRDYFQALIDPAATVLEIGAGYCDFINCVRAARKFALDVWPGIREHCASDVEAVVGSATDMDAVPDASVDIVFASNVFEHLGVSEFAEVLQRLRRKVKPRGRLIILQPNFRYAFREYFDDYTHRSIWTDVSLSDFLLANGFQPELVKRRFLPLTLRSRLPVWRSLIRLYLLSPFKPFGKQMLVVARLR